MKAPEYVISSHQCDYVSLYVSMYLSRYTYLKLYIFLSYGYVLQDEDSHILDEVKSEER